ncbi:MAG: MFS transporter [Planctomycetota bacterium]
MHLERQLRWLRSYALVTYPFACVPFLFLFFADHGMSAGEYGEILTAYYLTMFVAEVPTGVLADRFGARRMLVIGPGLLAAGFATFVLWRDYPGFVLGEILLGLGHSVLSGPPTVVLYETLKAHGQEQRYLAEESRVHARRLYGTGTAFLLGGTLVRFGNEHGTAYEPAILATAALNLVAALLASRLLGPRTIVAPERVRAPFLRHAGDELRKTPVRWLLLYWVVLFTLLRFPFHNYQPYLEAIGETEPLFANAIAVGVIFALLNLFAAPLSSKVPQLVARWGRRPLFWGMPLVLCASMLVMAFERRAAASGGAVTWFCWIGVAMFFVQQVPFAMHWSLIHEFVNHRIGSHARTTVLSVLSLGARAVYAVANVLLFHLQEREGMARVLFTAAGAGALATAVALWLRPRGLLRGREPLG